jgi:hypothetical protein
VLQAAAIALEPFGRGLGAPPVWGADGETVEGVAEGFADQFQPVQDPNGRQHMRRVGPLSATRLEEAALARPSQEGVEPQEFGLAGDEPGPELTQHGMVDARISQLQAQGICPVQAAAYGVSRLAVGQTLGTRHDRGQRETPGRLSGLPASRKERGTELIVIDGPDCIT